MAINSRMSDDHYIHYKNILWIILVFFASWRLGWTILIWLFVLILIVLLFRCLRTLAGKLNLDLYFDKYIIAMTSRFQTICIKVLIFDGPLSRGYRRLLGVCSWPSWSSSKSLPNFQGARYLSCKSPSSCPKSIFKKDFRYSMSKIYGLLAGRVT